jgi:hypothetical protein
MASTHAIMHLFNDYQKKIPGVGNISEPNHNLINREHQLVM